MAKSHPHIDTPTPAQLGGLVAQRPSEIAATYLALHQLVIAALPELRFSVDEVDAAVGYGAHQFGYNGWGMISLSPYATWVSLTLMAGGRLPDPHGLLQGTASMRHVKLSRPEQVEENRAAIAALVLEAARVNEQSAE